MDAKYYGQRAQISYENEAIHVKFAHAPDRIISGRDIVAVCADTPTPPQCISENS